MSPCPLRLLGLATLAAAALTLGCKPKDAADGTPASTTIQNKGSDTMVNVAQVWAEEYKKAHPTVDVEVSGGGTGVGIAALIRGTIDIATASRNMKAEEIAQAVKNTGKNPKEIIVGYDALAVYVHKDNPLEEISTEQLSAIYEEGGTVSKWSELGITLPSGQDEIVRVSRQSSSGTYEFFREHVLHKRDFKLGSRDMNGSKEVVELVGTTVSAIGYSGMGYHDPRHVKMLKVRTHPDRPAIAPCVATTIAHEYPIARSLLLYTLGEPQGELKAYIEWILSPAGQHIVEQSGYVPVPPAK